MSLQSQIEVQTFRRILIAAATITAVLSAASARAQQAYKQMAAPDDAKTWSKIVTSTEYQPVTGMLRGDSPADNAVIDKFFLQMVYPHFTRTENFQDFKTNNSLQKMRRTCKSSYFNAAKSGPLHEHLNEITLKFMDDIAQDTYHPVARANAMLMIADLNETDPNGAPWKKALPSLLKGVTNSATIDAVRVPALRGLVRHAQAGIDQAARPQVIDAMLAVLNEANPPADRTADGHAWIRQRAIDVLAAMKEPGQNSSVVDALQKTIADANSPPSVRAAAADALASIKFTPGGNFDACSVAKSMAKVAVDSYKRDLADAAQNFKPIASDRIKRDLAHVHRGLVGDNGQGGLLAMNSAAPYQKFVAALGKAIDNLTGACNTPPLPQPTAPTSTSAGAVVVVPIDTQEPLAKAIAQAGSNLEAVIQSGEEGGPAPAGTPAGGPVPEASPVGSVPAGIPGLPPG